MAIELFTWRAAPSTGGVCVFYAELLSGAGYDYYQETLSVSLRKVLVFIIIFIMTSCQLKRSVPNKSYKKISHLLGSKEAERPETNINI